MSRHYWWPKICQDVHDYVKGCADCQRNKINTHPIRAPLQPIYPKPEALPFETIALDFITKLPESEGSDSILTVVDHDCTKAAIFIPCREEITAEETAGLYVRHVFTRYGLPSRIISDRDPRFASKFTRELCRILGISQNISTAYHPRTDGQSEAKNKWVEQHLQFYVNHYQKNWTYYLPMAEFTHNTWASETTRESPFTLLMGYNPCADWIDRLSPIPQVALRIQQFKEARERAQQSMIKAQKSWVKHKDTPKFQSGNLVWLEGKNLQTVQPTAKLVPKRHGPFKITQVMSAVNYRLELPTQWSIHPVFHIDLLTPYHETTIHGANYQRPPPDLVEGEEEYEVETVLASRRFGRGKKLQYLVKWKGYPDSDNQWINKEDVFADNAIREFKNSNPNQETHIRRVNVDSPYPHFPPPLLMQNNTTTPATSTTVSDNWTIRDDSIASTSTVSSVPSQSSETTRSQYSFRVEDGGEPISVELQLPTSLEESTTAAESPQSVNSEFPITYYVHGQEAPIPFSLTNEAHIVIGSQENQTPITVPPPGNSPALRHI
jgi:transposase InsO family protein